MHSLQKHWGAAGPSDQGRACAMDPPGLAAPAVGIIIRDGDGATEQNTITGGAVGIGVVADTQDTVGILRGDGIRQTSVAPVREIVCCGFTATAIVK